MKVPRAALFLIAASLVAIAIRPLRAKFQAQRIVRISRVVSDLDTAEVFYRDALGFETMARGSADKAMLFALGWGDAGAEEVVMRLGTATIALVRFNVPGRDYPRGSRSNDLWFQHLAIVVNDMDEAYAHLGRVAGWQAISDGGPQQLPLSNGGVRAFKFRDPDGHPLELIRFPPSGHDGGRSEASTAIPSGPLFLNVDHSALAVSATTRSLNCYRGLGFRVHARSINGGLAQDRLDGLPAANVRVTGLRPASDAGPGLELLGYRPPGKTAKMTRLNDVATDWVTIEVASLAGERYSAKRDPDGHLLLLVDKDSGVPAYPLPSVAGSARPSPRTPPTSKPWFSLKR